MLTSEKEVFDVTIHTIFVSQVITETPLGFQMLGPGLYLSFIVSTKRLFYLTICKNYKRSYEERVFC